MCFPFMFLLAKKCVLQIDLESVNIWVFDLVPFYMQRREKHMDPFQKLRLHQKERSPKTKQNSGGPWTGLAEMQRVRSFCGHIICFPYSCCLFAWAPGLFRDIQVQNKSAGTAGQNVCFEKLIMVVNIGLSSVYDTLSILWISPGSFPFGRFFFETSCGKLSAS